MIIHSTQSFPGNKWLLWEAKLSEVCWEVIEFEVRSTGILRNDSQEGTVKACSPNSGFALPRKIQCFKDLSRIPLPLGKVDRSCPYLPLILLP